MKIGIRLIAAALGVLVFGLSGCCCFGRCKMPDARTSATTPQK